MCIYTPATYIVKNINFATMLKKIKKNVATRNPSRYSATEFLDQGFVI